jgi:hypothetical protein
MADPFADHERKSAEQAAAYAAENRALQQRRPAAGPNGPINPSDLTLTERVRARVEFMIRKRDGKMLDVPRSDYEVDQEIEETINQWSTLELLDAISLELEEKEAGG